MDNILCTQEDLAYYHSKIIELLDNKIDKEINSKVNLKNWKFYQRDNDNMTLEWVD